MNSRSDNIELMINDKENQVIEKTVLISSFYISNWVGNNIKS